jgi:hypothetical protein
MPSRLLHCNSHLCAYNPVQWRYKQNSYIAFRGWDFKRRSAHFTVPHNKVLTLTKTGYIKHTKNYRILTIYLLYFFKLPIFHPFSQINSSWTYTPTVKLSMSATIYTSDCKITLDERALKIASNLTQHKSKIHPRGKQKNIHQNLYLSHVHFPVD